MDSLCAGIEFKNWTFTWMGHLLHRMRGTPILDSASRAARVRHSLQHRDYLGIDTVRRRSLSFTTHSYKWNRFCSVWDRTRWRWLCSLHNLRSGAWTQRWRHDGYPQSNRSPSWSRPHGYRSFGLDYRRLARWPYWTRNCAIRALNRTICRNFFRHCRAPYLKVTSESV